MIDSFSYILYSVYISFTGNVTWYRALPLVSSDVLYIAEMTSNVNKSLSQPIEMSNFDFIFILTRARIKNIRCEFTPVLSVFVENYC